ncbi:MAG: uracil phosphoribosyltransferase [Actinomycetota bacterium]
MTWPGVFSMKRTSQRIEIHDGSDTLRMVRKVGIARPRVRQYVDELAEVLAEHTHRVVRKHAPYGAPVLCVFLLRGGALLYPAFAARFRDADVCFLGLRRIPDGVVCDYATPVPRESYEAVLLVDCIVGTGATVRAARAHLGPMRQAREYVATLCSARQTTASLVADGLTFIGLALDEDLDDGLVLPDLGHLDAGDVFSQA